MSDAGDTCSRNVYQKLVQETCTRKTWTRLTDSDTSASLLYKRTDCTSLWCKFLERVSPALKWRCWKQDGDRLLFHGKDVIQFRERERERETENMPDRQNRAILPAMTLVAYSDSDDRSWRRPAAATNWQSQSTIYMAHACSVPAPSQVK